MSRAAINANVSSNADRNIGADLRRCIKKKMPMLEFCERYNMTCPAVNDRLNDPDKFTLGQIREMRIVLGMTKDEVMELVRGAL